MRHSPLCITLAAALASIAAVTPSLNASARQPTQPTAATPSPDRSPLLPLTATWRAGRSPEVLGLLDNYVELQLQNDPLRASTRGDLRYNDRLPEVGPEATRRDIEAHQVLLAHLETLGTLELSEVDRTDIDLLRHVLNERIEGARFHAEQTPIDARSGPQVWLPQMGDTLAFHTDKDFADYAARLEQVPRVIDQTIEQLRAGLRSARMPPKVVMLGVEDQCSLLSSKDVEESIALSPFFKPLIGRPVTDPAVGRARGAIANGIIPAYRRLAEFLRTEYLPKCRETFGISQGVDGPEAYDFALRAHTTTKLTAPEIHAIGIQEVARIRGEMMQVIARSDFPEKTTLAGDDLFRAFVQYLRTDKRFYCTTPEQLVTGYRDICKRMDAELPKLFGTLPRLPYGVREIPAFAAPMSPTAYYYPGSAVGGLAGYFVCNTYKLDQRPTYEMTALALHEAVPGHHLQIALAQELEGSHPFRTMVDVTAFVEGWGLYSERLGLEVGGEGGTPNSPGGTGLYADPYVDFGRLTYEMWRACRLVVDTGLHSKQWSRREAIEYMLVNTALSQHNIEREVDRYIAWPGQATAYKIGQLKISQLRARAEVALGAKFDIRAFHDTVLGAGAIPLPTLEARVDRWIQSRK